MRFVAALPLLALTPALAPFAALARAADIELIDAAGCYAVREFRLSGAPASARPFDPEAITVDARFTVPSGRTTAIGTDGKLVIDVPACAEDLAGHLLPEDRLSLHFLRLGPNREFDCDMVTDHPGHYAVEQSSDVMRWDAATELDAAGGRTPFNDAGPPFGRQAFYRARRAD